MEESQTKQRPGTNKLYLISALKDLTTFSILNLRELKENEGLLLQEETALSSLIEQQNKGDDLTKSINKASESLLDKKNHEIKLLNEQGRLANLIRTIQQQIEQKQQDIVVSQEQEAKTYKIESQDYQKEKRQYKEILRKYDLQSKEFKMSSRLKKQFQKIKKSKQNRKQIEESKEIKKNQDEKKGKIKDQKKSESKRDLNKINTEEEQEQVNLSENEMQNMNIVNEQVEEEEKKIKDFSVNIPFEQTYIDQIKDNLDSKDEEKKILQSESTGKEENIITHDKFENDDFNRIPENNTQKDYGQLSKVIQQLMLEIKNLTTKQEEQQIINQKFFENQEKRGKEIEDLGKRIEDQEKKIREIEKKIEENGKGIPEIENEIDNQQGTYEKQEKTNQEIKNQIIKLSETYLIQGEEIKALKKKKKRIQ